MTDEQALKMPAYRFWALETQISRIESARDLRQINVHRSVTGKEEMKEIVEKLTIELGETCKVVHSQFVKPEPAAKAKFQNIMNMR